ncbi:MAG: DNA-binding LytR/AlgR family response regulator [Patescibacteria group bacterium]|jgi:DNA-binding LytR/AlgR family response regulator
MSKIKILIVEDEPLYAGQLEMIITELGHIPIGKADNASLALELVREKEPELILMDVNLNGGIDGIETATMIATNNYIPVIFITSMQDDATFERAKSTLPHAFITKPFSAKRLQRNIELIINRIPEETPNNTNIPKDEVQLTAPDTFFIKSKNTLEKITLPDVLWIEVTNRDCNIHTLSKTIIVRMPFAELMNKLSYKTLIQVHRSYIINTAHISSLNLSENTIIIKEKEIPVSKTFKEQVLQHLRII